MLESEASEMVSLSSAVERGAASMHSCGTKQQHSDATAANTVTASCAQCRRAGVTANAIVCVVWSRVSGSGDRSRGVRGGVG